ncbi:MAG: RNA polymerase sigma factor [Ruminococcus sp.]|nr:RNA polymerase sigma factor [Ruminococcus sp.]
MRGDEERYRRFLNGDDNGLRELIDIYHAGLTLFVNGIVGDPTETEDIVQDTFVKLAVKKPRFDGRCSFKTWLYTIARNKAYNHLKRHRARFTDQPIDELFTLSDGSDLERDYLRSKQNIAVHRAMRELNADYFQVLYLTYFEGQDTEGAAKIMHKTKRQIGDLLYRAKKSLREKLERAGFSYEEL